MSNETTASPPDKQPSGKHLLTLIVLLVLAIPSGAIASITTCGAVFGWSENLGFILGPIVGIGVAGWIIYLAIRDYRRSRSS